MKQLRITIVLVIALSLLSSSCKEKKGMSESNTTENMTQEQDNNNQNVVIDQSYINKKTDDYSLLESSIKGDILKLHVQYGGGCETHEWELKTNGAYAKSLPPQITLNLEHNSNNDMCRALVRDTLEFNLEEIRYPGSFAVDIRLFSFEKTTIRYQYN